MSVSAQTDVFDVCRIGTDVTSKITLTPGQSAVAWALAFNTVAVNTMATFLPWYTGAALYALPPVFLALTVLIIVPDILFLPYMKRNIARVEAAGFGRMEWIGAVWAAMALVAFFAWLPTRFISSIAEAEPRFTAEFFLKAIACAFVSDVPFFLLHRALHHRFPRLHLLHHLCVDPCISTSFIIDPIDAVIGFALPGSVMVFLTLVVLGDPWVHLGAAVVFSTWYIISHDPQLRMSHYYHHAHCDSRYNIYVPLKTVHDPKDKVRAEVFKIRQQEREAAKKQQQ